MHRFAALFFVLVFNSAAMAQGSGKTEFVTGGGFVWASLGRSVEFTIDVSQLDPAAAGGSLSADFFSFPGHHVRTLESISIDSVDVVRKQGLVTGTAQVVDILTQNVSTAQFSIVFEDVNSRRRSDTMLLTLFLASGTETYTGDLYSGDVTVGVRRQ
jgi:hypothetical protein